MAMAPTGSGTTQPHPRTAPVRTDLGVDEALDHILAAFGTLPEVRMPLHAAHGLVLAEDVVTPHDLPPFSNSAMDGFAVRSADTIDASAAEPVSLIIRGSVAAGYVSGSPQQAGEATRIMTGAPIPEGADAVIRVEDTETIPVTGGNERVIIRRPVPPGDCVRLAGEDARQGTTLLTAGTPVRPPEIGLLAATGHANAMVYRRPRIGVLVTGDEIIPAGEPLGPGKIWNSNGPMIAAQIQQSGGEPVMLGIATDSAAAVRERLLDCEGLDLLVTTGGVSVGDFDVVKDVLQQEGRVELWKLRMKPGKPLAFGWIGNTPVVGLPGNPVAAAVACWQFVHPVIRKMLGHTDLLLRTVPARLLDRIDNRGDRRQFVRVEVVQERDGYTARIAGSQDSHILTSLTRGNGLLVIPEACDVAEIGMTFEVQMLQ